MQSKDHLLEPDMLLLQCWLAAAAAPAADTAAAAAAAAAAGLSPLQVLQRQGGTPAAVATLLAAFGVTPLMHAAGEARMLLLCGCWW
jgi:hypothetical protein